MHSGECIYIYGVALLVKMGSEPHSNNAVVPTPSEDGALLSAWQCTQVCVYTYVCMYVCVYIYTYLYMYTCVYMYIYIYINMHIYI